MTSDKKTPETGSARCEEIETAAQVFHQHEDLQDDDQLDGFREETLKNLLHDQNELRQTLVKSFGVPVKSASDLVVSMADMCGEFSEFIVKVGSYQEEGTVLELDQLFHNFFNHRGYGLTEGHCVFAEIPGTWSTHFLNEFLLNTVTFEIPFVYLSGDKVEVLAIPDSAFWMDFKLSLEATGDWDRLQSRSDKSLNARSILSHAAKSALVCHLGKLDIPYPPHALDILFKYIDTPRLLEIFTWNLDCFDNDESESCATVAAGDYDWDDLLAELGCEADPETVDLRSKQQVDEFMGIYKGFRGAFIGYELDQHGILRYRVFDGWPAYIRYRNRYPGASGKARQIFH